MQKSLGDSFRAILYGPSWIPGAPRLGRDEDKVNVSKQNFQLLRHLILFQKFYMLVFE